MASGTQALVRGLAALNSAYPWNHNAYYHRWILRRVPPRPGAGSAPDAGAGTAPNAGAGSALDVGCGTGDLARLLATRTTPVHGIDADPGMVERARDLTPDGAPVSFSSGDALTGAPPGPHRVITCVAVLHHLPLDRALTSFRDHLAPGGTLLVVGLAEDHSPAARVLGLLSAALNPVIGFVRNRGRRAAAAPVSMSAPTRAATATLPEVRAAADRLLPGARIRPGLFWRYTLEWRRPDADMSEAGGRGGPRGD